MKTVAFHNLGCKVNDYETDIMQQKFMENGFQVVPFSQKADIYVVNTCTVTNIADRKSRQMIHKAHKTNPDAIVVAMGCYVETGKAQAMEDAGIDILIGNNDKGRAFEVITEFINNNLDKESSLFFALFLEAFRHIKKEFQIFFAQIQLLCAAQEVEIHLRHSLGGKLVSEDIIGRNAEILRGAKHLVAGRSAFIPLHYGVFGKTAVSLKLCKAYALLLAEDFYFFEKFHKTDSFLNIGHRVSIFLQCEKNLEKFLEKLLTTENILGIICLQGLRGTLR